MEIDFLGKIQMRKSYSDPNTIAYLEDLQELGVEMVSDKGIEDDYITLTKEVKEDSEEFEELKERGFVKVEFDKEGRNLA